MLQAFAYWDSSIPGGIRWGTLLIANGDPTVVGNAVLKNPGSAFPLESSLFGRDDGRQEFSVDATMQALAELFQLQTGTIRLFNLLDIRAVDPKDAVKQLNNGTLEYSREDVAQEILTGPHVPTYLGWGNLWKHPAMVGKAKRIFEAALPNSPALNPRIEDNRYIHPLYLMRYGFARPECYTEIKRFRASL